MSNSEYEIIFSYRTKHSAKNLSEALAFGQVELINKIKSGNINFQAEVKKIDSDEDKNVTEISDVNVNNNLLKKFISKFK